MDDLKNKLDVLLGLMALLANLNLPAQTTPSSFGPNLRLERIPSELGLSQNLITCMMQDRKGFLWFGTKDGLNKFDGYKFTVFRHDPFDSTSLSDSYVTALLEDRAGRIGVGTFSGGLNLFEREREIFHHSLPIADNPKSLSHERINALAEDQEGAIWIGTYGGGLNKLVLPAATKLAVAPSPSRILKTKEGRSGAGAGRDEEGKALNDPHGVPNPQGSMPKRLLQTKRWPAPFIPASMTRRVVHRQLRHYGEILCNSLI